MNLLRLNESTTELATTETVTWAIDWTAALADEGEGVTAVNATVTLTSISTGLAAPDGAVGDPDVATPLINLPMVGSGLTVGDRYQLVVSVVSSAGNTQSRELTVFVPF